MQRLQVGHGEVTVAGDSIEHCQLSAVLQRDGNVARSDSDGMHCQTGCTMLLIGSGTLAPLAGL